MKTPSFTLRSLGVLLRLISPLLLGACGARRAGEEAGSTTRAAVPGAADGNGSQAVSRRTYTKPPDEELRARLSPLEYEVTQREATEPPFSNRYWDNHEAGLYVDVATGEPLFGSADKFDSGTGWPSFTKPVEAGRVVARPDGSHGMARTEVRSRGGDSHLGHVFEDGPAPTRLRYCINSAALRFVPVDRLQAEGYAEYRALFDGRDARDKGDTLPPMRSAAREAAPSAAAAPAPDGGAAANACTTPPPEETPGCQSTLETAILAGGCFWGMEEILRKVPGVLETEVGYTGGGGSGATYEQVKTGATGHAEAVRIVFDPAKLSYRELLERWFFRMHDPTTKDRQGNDVGTQYRSAIFVTSPAQRRIAEQVKSRVAASSKWKAPVVTEIADAGPFTRAEDYHQRYLANNPGGYTCHYLRD